MSANSSIRDYREREEVAREIMRKIAAMDPYVQADPDEVEERLRNMNYGATNSRISKLRRAESEETFSRIWYTG